MQLGIPDRERDKMIAAMVESSQNAERLEGARLLVQLGRSEQAGPVLREIARRGSKEDSAEADELLKWDRARVDALRQDEAAQTDAPAHGTPGPMRAE
jgi:hypothetical protein